MSEGLSSPGPNVQDNTLNLTEFKPTPKEQSLPGFNESIIKKLSKSKSNENLKSIAETTTANEPIAKKTNRGRKSKYTTDEERKEARRQQQREYRLRKKQELESLRKYAEEHLRYDNGESILYKVMEEQLYDDEEEENINNDEPINNQEPKDDEEK